MRDEEGEHAEEQKCREDIDAEGREKESGVTAEGS
jgi:hypothetical protein